MQNIKQIIIDKDIHRKLKIYCVHIDSSIRDFTEAAIIYAMQNKIAFKEQKEETKVNECLSEDVVLEQSSEDDSW